MLQVEFIRDLHNNYMVLKGAEGDSNYIHKMLLNNVIPGILRVELRIIDQNNLYYYDITALKTMSSVYAMKSLSYKEIKYMLSFIFDVIDKSRDYLLPENDFVIEPEYIYMDSDLHKYYLCLYIGYQVTIQDQLTKLIEYLMNKVDYKEEQAVLLTYALYKVSREEDCTYQKLIDEINKTYGNESKNENRNESGKKSENYSVDEDRNENRKETGNENRKETGNENGKEIGIESRKKTGKEDGKDNRKETGKIIGNETRKIRKYEEERSILKQPSSCSKDYINVEMSNKNKSNKLKDLISSNCQMNSGGKKQKKKRQEEKKQKKKNPAKFPMADKNPKMKPVHDEIENEYEITCYTNKSYILAAISVVGGVLLFILLWNLKLLNNSFGTRLDLVKVLCALIMIIILEIYVFIKLFDKNNLTTKIKTKTEYMDSSLMENMVTNPEEDPLSFLAKGNLSSPTDTNQVVSESLDIAGSDSYSSKPFFEYQKMKPIDSIVSEKQLYRQPEQQYDQPEPLYNQPEPLYNQPVPLYDQPEHLIREPKQLFEEPESHISDEKTQVLWTRDEMDENKTEILMDLKNKKNYFLESLNETDRNIIPINSFPFTVGKSKTNISYMIQDSSISRLHAKFVCEGGIFVIDLNSTNGTFLNGIKLKENKLFQLYSGDELTFSHLKYRLKEIKCNC